MSNYPKMTITYAGHDMIAESQADKKPLIFTKVVLGDGQLSPGQRIEELTAPLAVRMEVPLSFGQKQSNGQVKLRFSVSNAALDEGFFVREVTVYAKVGDSGQERLYAYSNGGNYVDFIPDKTNPVDAQIVNIYIVTGNATNVQIVVDSAIYMTIADLNEAIAAHNTAPDAHEHRFSQYLPLAGGAMSGAITVGNCPGMRKATDHEETYIYGGTMNKDGAALGLIGINCMDYGEEARGSFNLVAISPSGERHTLVGLKDGRLLWDRKSIVYLEEVITWQSPTGEEWYYAIRWADGHAEIHGHAIQKANNLGITLNYPIPLVSGITGEATVVAKAGSAFTALVSFTFGTSSVGYFTVRNYDYGVPTEPISICFTVRGYWK